MYYELVTETIYYKKKYQQKLKNSDNSGTSENVQLPQVIKKPLARK